MAKKRTMRPRIMWCVLNAQGKPIIVVDTRREAREDATDYTDARVVRVRVTEAP